MSQARLANTEMERVASLFVADVASQGLKLDYAPDSLKAIDKLLAGYGHGQGNGKKNAGLVELVGAYFGQVLRLHLGGDWYEGVPPDGATGLLLSERYDMWLWCHSIVYKQLELGNKSLGVIFEDVSTSMKELGI